MGWTVIGAGSWGTALALVLARNGLEVRIIGRDNEALHDLQTRRENFRYLPGHLMPKQVIVEEWDDAEAWGDCAILAVPTQAVPESLPKLLGYRTIVIATKGLAPGSCGLLDHVVSEAVPDARVVVLSGPNLAVELAQGVPTVAVAASRDESAASLTRDALTCRSLRVYLSDDVTGVSLAGALKNVYAIAAGISDGLGFGDNTRGALLARGLNEMARLGIKMGARLETFLGIAGVGDLFATASSKLSRNYRVGLALGKGERLTDALAKIGQVAEGVSTCEAGSNLARKHGVEMPILDVVLQIIHGRCEPRIGVAALMERTPKTEWTVLS